MATSVKLTKEFLVKFGNKVIARCTDFTFEVNKQTIDITSLDSQGWKELMVDMKEWKVTFNALVTRGNPGVNGVDYDALLNDIKTSTAPSAVAIATAITGDKFESGDAFLVTLNATGSVGDKVTYSGSFEGTGPLTTQMAA